MADLIDISVNGTPRQISAGGTVLALLHELQVALPHVAVEVNGELIPRGQHAQHELQPQDCIEVVTLVGGG